MKIFFIIILFWGEASFSQKLKKADKELVNNLQAHIAFLADDKLEGRRTGTPGEKLAFTYLTEQFKTIGLLPKGDTGTYMQQFTVNDGKQINNPTHLILKLRKNFFHFHLAQTGPWNLLR